MIYNDDCLNAMKNIDSNSIDAIIADVPYGVTDCAWDSVIPIQQMWSELNRIIKGSGAILLFSSQPFSSRLISENYKMFKHEIIWDKCVGGAFVLAKKRMLPSHENILLFSKGAPTYNPQMEVKPIKNRRPARPETVCTNKSIKIASGKRKNSESYKEELKYPTTILRYPKQMQECNNTKRVHPTQKPVALMEYLIKTYTNEGETVLDFTMGSGTTGVACVNTNRNFIGIELDKTYFDIASKRIADAQAQSRLL